MLIYNAACRWDGGVWLGEVLDFPGTVACGAELGEVRGNLAQALRDMAETSLMRGEALHLADASRCGPLAELEEPIHLVLQTR